MLHLHHVLLIYRSQVKAKKNGFFNGFKTHLILE